MKIPAIYARLSFLLFFVIIFSRCDLSKPLSEYSNQELASTITKNTGISVVLNTGNDDLCAHHQLLMFVQEYTYLSAKAQREFSNAFKTKYRQLIVDPTQTAQHHTGELVWLDLLQCESGGSNCVVTLSKEIKNTTTLTGQAPLTSIVADSGTSGLHVGLEWLSDERWIRFFDTQDTNTYDAIVAMDSGLFTSSLANGSVVFSREDTSVRGACSEPLPLQTLLL